MAEDEYWLHQTVVVTAKLTNPASSTAPVDPVTGETLTDDGTETLTAYREDNTLGPITGTVHGTTGLYTAQVTADQLGHWEVNDAKGGVYRFYVRPTRP